MLDVGRWTFCLILLPLLTHAATPPFTASPLTQDLHLRKNAPIPLEIQINQRSSEVLVGRFEATLLYRDRHAGTHRSAEMVLSSGTRAFTFLLPPPPGINDGDTLAVHLRWLGANGPLELGDHRLGTYGFSSNELVLAIGRTDRRLSELDRAREHSLALETLRPQIDTPGWRSFNTLASSVPVESLPLHPLGWCAYDAAFLDTAALAAASEKQLTALTRWIEAGGSAFLSVGDGSASPLVDHHADFLNRLAAGSGVTFRLEGSRLATNAPDPAQPLRLRPILGRVSVELTPRLSPLDYNANQWAAAVGWFWKMREPALREVEKKGHWPDRMRLRAEEEEPANDWEFAGWLWSSAIGYDALSPDKPRPLPLGLVALLLGTLLLAVGPGDWFLLGWLRRRRWTWLLLPVLCLLSAWWASQLAAHTIGRTDRTGLVVITDLGPDGRVLRESRLDMLLPAHDREWIVPIRDGLALPFPRLPDPAAGGDPPTTEETDITGEWKSAAQFESHRNLRQWTPVMAQSMSFPETQDTTAIPWEALAAEWASLSSEKRSRHHFDSAGWHVVFPAQRDGQSPPDLMELEAGPANIHLRTDGAIPEDSRLRYEIAETLLFRSSNSATSRLLSSRSPEINGSGALLATGPAPFAALAWRETAHEIHLVRRHFNRAP